MLNLVLELYCKDNYYYLGNMSERYFIILKSFFFFICDLFVYFDI